jgi:glutaredoxin
MQKQIFLYFLTILILIKKLNFKTNNTHFIKEFLNDKIYELSDMTFEDTINAGKYYKWCIIFYLKTCGHCKRAKNARDKIFKKVSDPKVRFAQLETEENMITNIRFNVTAVPYIVLIENNSMLELEKYPNEENLLNFCQSNFSNFEKEIIPYPKPIGMGKVSWIMFRETINGLIHQINYYLKKYGINHQMNFNEFLILAVLLLVIGGFLEYYILSMCMNDNYEEEIKKQIELIEKNEKIKKSKNKKEKDEQENDDKKELNEEDKIKEEEKIEKQFKEKNENDKNNNKKDQKEKND